MVDGPAGNDNSFEARKPDCQGRLWASDPTGRSLAGNDNSFEARKPDCQGRLWASDPTGRSLLFDVLADMPSSVPPHDPAKQDGDQSTAFQ